MQKIVEVPDGINLNIDESGSKVSVSGEKGSLERQFNIQSGIKIEKRDNIVLVSSESDRRKIKAMVGTIQSHINNMISGVSEGFAYKMKIVYVHFPMNIKVSVDRMVIENFLGENRHRTAKILDGVSVKVEGEDVTVTGINKEKVGQTCANIEVATKVMSRDRRTFQDGIFLMK